MISSFGVWNCKISFFDLWRSARVKKERKTNFYGTQEKTHVRLLGKCLVKLFFFGRN